MLGFVHLPTFKSGAGDGPGMDVLSLLREFCPAEPQELGHKFLLLPRFVGLHFFSVPLLSLEDLTEFESRGNNEVVQSHLLYITGSEVLCSCPFWNSISSISFLRRKQSFTTSLARKVQGICSEVKMGEGQHE